MMIEYLIINFQQKKTIHICLKRSHIGWVKLNRDGAWKGIATHVGCGELH
jgi:hypothetical protein